MTAAAPFLLTPPPPEKPRRKRALAPEASVIRACRTAAALGVVHRRGAFVHGERAYKPGGEHGVKPMPDFPREKIVASRIVDVAVARGLLEPCEAFNSYRCTAAGLAAAKAPAPPRPSAPKPPRKTPRRRSNRP